MREELAAALTEVGVAAPAHSNVESLVRVACLKLDLQRRSLRAVDRRETEWRVQVRQALIQAGRDPGSHASLDDMIAELVAIAKGRLIR